MGNFIRACTTDVYLYVFAVFVRKPTMHEYGLSDEPN